MNVPRFISLVLVAGALSAGAAEPIRGWLNWRGPEQTSVSHEKGLPATLDAKKTLWTADFPGQSTPVIANGRLYINGYLGDGQDLQEVVRCFDAESGKLIWEHRESDFLSDTIYLRYSTSSPTVDPETGNVFVQGTQGMLFCFTPDGKILWKHSMMEKFGRLTFPNSRTATPVVDKELVIIRGITSSWGAHGAAGDRFYAFDKKTGDLVWSSAPGDRPQDNTFSQPYLDFWNGKRVLYSAGGDSTILAINARTGEPLWRFPFAKAGAKGGINAALIRYKDKLIAVHESENVDSSEIGRMSAFRIPVSVTPSNATTPYVFGPKELEVWRQPKVGSLASSPILVDNMIYEVTGVGDLAAIDADTGKLLWEQKLAIEQRQSTPFYADGKLYVAMYTAALGEEAAKKAAEAGEAGGAGELFVIKPSREKCEILSRTLLEGKCFGSPIGYNGKLYVQTDKKLYAFGKAGNNPGLPPQAAAADWPKAGPATQLQAIPYEVLLKPSEKKSFRIRSLDANGFTVDENIDPKSVKWESFIPPTALVKATMKAAFDAEGHLVADAALAPSAGQFKATLGQMTGYIKGRILPGLPLKVDFENVELSNMTTNTIEPATAFNFPPLPWNSARFRFEVRQAPGEGSTKALTKTIDNKLFQRGQIFFGHPETKNYTLEADVMTEGNRRKMSEVGVINQRYIIVLKGNSQELEVNSNQERIKVAVPFKWAPNAWYTIKSRVDVAADGSGVVKAKAWKKGDPEPEAWTIQVPHKFAHANGTPGLFAFTPQEQRAYIDNISVTAN